MIVFETIGDLKKHLPADAREQIADLPDHLEIFYEVLGDDIKLYSRRVFRKAGKTKEDALIRVLEDL